MKRGAYNVYFNLIISVKLQEHMEYRLLIGTIKY